MSPTLALIGVRADQSTVLTVAVGADIWANLEFIVVVAAVVVAAGLSVVIIAACDVEVLASMLTGILVCGVSSASPEVNAICFGEMLSSL